MLLEDIGVIKAVEIPDSWASVVSEHDLSEFGGTPMCRVYEAEDGSRIYFYYRGQPLDVQTASAFSRILAARRTQVSVPELSSAEVVELTNLFGLTTLGDNQYSNPAPPEYPSAAVFHMDSAAAFLLNGRDVISVRGRFVSGTRYSGIFVPVSTDHRIVEEIYLESRNDQNGRMQETSFERVLQSIVW